MLVLARKVGESIRIDDTIVVTLLEMKGSSVRLGIEAPKKVPIWREEIYQPTTEAVGEFAELGVGD